MPTVPVFDCTRFFQGSEDATSFPNIASLRDFFAQTGPDVSPRISGLELRKKSFVGVCYTAGKFGVKGSETGNFSLSLNIRAVYLLLNGPAV